MKTYFRLLPLLLLFLVSCSTPQRAEPSERHLFQYYFDAMNQSMPYVSPEAITLSKSTVKDAIQLIRSFPDKPDEPRYKATISDNFEYYQARYDHSFFEFHIGKEKDRWLGKIYEMHFNVQFLKQYIAAEETSVYRALRKDFGKEHRKEFFRYSDTDVADDLQLYIWEFPKMVVTYRGFYSKEEDRTHTVLVFWDREFYQSHKYYKY